MQINFITKAVLVVMISFVMLSQAYTAFAADKIVLNTDRSIYSIGMKVIVVGQVLGSFTTDSPAQISVSGPSGSTYHSGPLALDDSGGFTHEFTVNGDGSLVGTNTIDVKHQINSGMVSGTLKFEVRERATIGIQMNKDSYNLGDDVILQGRVSPVLPDSQVLIQVFNPRNDAWSFKSVSSSNISSDGQFTIELGNLGGSRSIAGTYTVKAFYAASTAIVTRTFSVVGSNEQSGSQSDSTQSNNNKQSNQGEQSFNTPAEVEVVEKDSSSAAPAEVSKETVVQSEIRNTKEEAQEFTYIVLIKDSEGITISLSWVKGMLAPSQSLTMEQPWVPEAPGQYTAEIFVWESFNNPVALSGKMVETIIVK